MPVPSGQTPNKLTVDQVATVAYAAGFRGKGLATIVAIGGPESGYVANNFGDLGIQDAKWGPSIGLFQIRSVKAESGKGTSRDANRLTDPLFNAQSAYTISGGGTSFGPWTTYGTGAYLPYLPAATAAAHAAELRGLGGGPQTLPGGGFGVSIPGLSDIPGVGDVLGSPGDFLPELPSLPNPLAGIEAVGAFFSALLDPHTWFRILWVLGGLGLAGISLYMLNADLVNSAGAVVKRGAEVAAIA